MENASELVEPLQRAVAVPGTFDTAYPSTGEDDLIGLLLDGFAEAQLDGFLSDNTYIADPDDVDYGLLDPVITQPEGALIVIYSSSRLLANELSSRKTHIRYEASGAVFEQDYSAQVLVERLKEIRARITDMRTQASTAGAGSAFLMADMYLGRALEVTFWPSGGLVLPDLG